MPVVPATQEAEAGELPEPRRWRLRWAEITPLHSSLGNKSETPSQKKKKNHESYDTYKSTKWTWYSFYILILVGTIKCLWKTRREGSKFDKRNPTIVKTVRPLVKSLLPVAAICPYLGLLLAGASKTDRDLASWLPQKHFYRRLFPWASLWHLCLELWKTWEMKERQPLIPRTPPSSRG